MGVLRMTHLSLLKQSLSHCKLHHQKIITFHMTQFWVFLKISYSQLYSGQTPFNQLMPFQRSHFNCSSFHQHSRNPLQILWLNFCKQWRNARAISSMTFTVQYLKRQLLLFNFGSISRFQRLSQKTMKCNLKW